METSLSLGSSLITTSPPPTTTGPNLDLGNGSGHQKPDCSKSSMSSSIGKPRSLYSGELDPEPRRCRRTDGKKWRCRKQALPDDKYCDRSRSTFTEAEIDRRRGYVLTNQTEPSL